MDISRRSILAATGSSLALVGCIGADDEPADTTGPSASDDTDPSGDAMDETADPADDAPTVLVRSHPDLGAILVGPDENTLYAFDADPMGDGESACHDDCAAAWPPLTVSDTPAAGPDVTAELATFERADGMAQVTANGWPLYGFIEDEQPGAVTGQGHNASWWVLRPDGTPIRDADEDTDPDAADTDDPDEQEADEADVTVTVGESGLHFDPETLEIDTGDTVAFDWAGDGHNIVVTAHPNDSSWMGVPELRDAGFTHYHTFEVSGQFEYMCEPHEDAGMRGRITVTERADDGEIGGGY